MPVNSFDQYPLTWKPDKERLSPPYYRSLAADLEQNIRSGQLKPGTKLPPQREIADYLDLNYTTITRVYSQCKQKGLIYGTTGKGAFVAPHAGEEAPITAGGLSAGCVEMGAVNGFGEYSELVEQATKAVVEKGYLRRLYEYASPQGHPHQRAAAARWLEQLGVHADPERLAILPGAQNALTVALISLFSPGDRIAVDAYTYANFLELARLLHLVLIPIRGDGDGMLPEELERQCRAKRLRGLYLIPTYSNPTTVTIPLERRRALADVIRRNGLILLEDDVSTWLAAVEGRVLPSLFDLLDGESVYICGTTKSLCPGLRIACLAFAERFRESLLHGLVNVNIQTSAFDAEVITELILNGDAYEIAVRKYELAARNARLFHKYFPGAGQGSVVPGYYQWLPFSSDKSPALVEQELTDQGVHVYHSARFTVLRDQPRDYLRVSLCSAGSARKLERGLSILRQYLQDIEPQLPPPGTFGSRKPY